MGKKERKAEQHERERRDEARIEPLLRLIDQAFDGAAVPDAEHRTLYQAEAWDDYRKVDRRRDHEGRWQDLPDAHLVDCQNALAYLDEQGIPYYLPALMRHYLRRGRRLWIHDSLLFTLEPSTGDLKDYQRRRFSRLTPPQRAAILKFLEHVTAADPIPDPVMAAWRRVVEAGDDPDWFRHFY